MRLTGLMLEAPARCEHRIQRFAAAERGKRLPGGSAGIRAECILCAGDVTQKAVGSFLAAERAIGVSTSVSAGIGRLPALEHASQRRCAVFASGGLVGPSVR